MPCLTLQVRDGEEEAENQETEEMSLESIMPKKPKEDTVPGTERSTMPNTAFLTHTSLGFESTKTNLT